MESDEEKILNKLKKNFSLASDILTECTDIFYESLGENMRLKMKELYPSFEGKLSDTSGNFLFLKNAVKFLQEKNYG